MLNYLRKFEHTSSFSGVKRGSPSTAASSHESAGWCSGLLFIWSVTFGGGAPPPAGGSSTRLPTGSGRTTDVVLPIINKYKFKIK